MSNVLDLKKDDFTKEVLESDLPVLVDFWAPWCMPCRMMSPILDELAVSMAGQIKVVKVNTEEAENQSLAAQYQIQSIPNMKLFKGGEVIAEFVGMRSKESLEQEIKDKI
ncbi:MAG: thioredoxin [Patescibacteria group bacterium]|jgi:thioredoxin 1|nr:thioredoxin [Patescibacteria group bacterium]